MSQPATQHDVERRVLELAAGGRWTGGDDAREAGVASATTVPGQDVCELAQVYALQRLRSARRASQRAVVEGGGEVEEGAGR